MLIGGMQSLTTLDYPGVVSAIVFTQGCNFHCPYCHNPDLISPRSGERPLSGRTVFDLLKKRQGILEGLVVSGGEPTIQPDLLEFCQEVKKLKYKVKLDTNGANPLILQILLAHQAVDYIAMDLKAAPGGLTAFTRQPSAWEAIKDSVNIIKSSGLPHEFRTTCVEPFIDASAVSELGALVGDSAWYLQPARLDGPVFSPGETMRAASASELRALLELALPKAPFTRLRG